MARLESEAKGGFYPTPPKEMELILKRISSDEDTNITLLDPCAGKGHALQQSQDILKNKGIETKTYGIELEESRSIEATNNLNHVLNCGYEDTRMSHHSFSMMYLNPPFAEFKGERTEKIFFRDLTKANGYLTNRGLVVLNIPQYVLGAMCQLISQRLEDVRVYRFTDKNFEAYSQVIVYGYRRRGAGTNDKLKRKLQTLAFAMPHDIPTLDTEDWVDVQYTLPKPQKDVSLFDTTFVDPKDIIESMNESDFHEQFARQIENPNVAGFKTKRPAMPLKTSHMATAISSGALPEEMGDHLLVGVTKTQISREVEEDEENHKTKEIENFQAKSLVRVFSQKGIFDLK